LFGRSLLINPVTTQGATQRSLYLPSGSDWIDFWTGKRMSGGETITVDAPLDRMPIYAKAGSIVVLGPRVESASAKSDPIELRIYKGSNADFALYEDEGDNYDYEHGAYSVIPLHWDDKAGTVTIGDRRGSFPGMLEHRTFHTVVVNDGHGTGIAVNSQPDVTIEYEGKATSAAAQAGSRP
jgi:alpha-D-xyloside xylohydrolase